MAKSTQRRGQVARSSKTTVGHKNNTNIAAEPQADVKKKAAANPASKGLPKAGGAMGSLADPGTMASATKMYSQRQSIDSMCRVIENEQGRSMEDKVKQLEYVSRLENDIEREAHGQVIEGVLEVVGAFFVSFLGLGWANKKGIIKLPPISLSIF